MNSAAQIRAARALLGLSHAELARRAGMSVSEIRRAEDDRLPDQPGDGREIVRRALGAAGVEFIDGHAPGVRLRPSPDEGLRPEQLTSENDG